MHTVAATDASFTSLKLIISYLRNSLSPDRLIGICLVFRIQNYLLRNSEIKIQSIVENDEKSYRNRKKANFS